MADYRVTYEVKDADLGLLLNKVHASLYLAEIEGVNVRLTEITDGKEFDYPMTQKLIKHLNEPVLTPPAEGEWLLNTDGENRVGDDVD